MNEIWYACQEHKEQKIQQLNFQNSQKKKKIYIYIYIKSLKIFFQINLERTFVLYGIWFLEFLLQPPVTKVIKAVNDSLTPIVA